MTLEDQIVSTLARLVHVTEAGEADVGYLLRDIVQAAALYWANEDPSDFVLHDYDDGTIIFGKENQLLYVPAEGFVPIKGSARFHARCRQLTPTPGIVPFMR